MLLVSLMKLFFKVFHVFFLLAETQIVLKGKKKKSKPSVISYEFTSCSRGKLLGDGGKETRNVKSIDCTQNVEKLQGFHTLNLTSIPRRLLPFFICTETRRRSIEMNERFGKSSRSRTFSCFPRCNVEIIL